MVKNIKKIEISVLKIFFRTIWLQDLAEEAFPEFE